MLVLPVDFNQRSPVLIYKYQKIYNIYFTGIKFHFLVNFLLNVILIQTNTNADTYVNVILIRVGFNITLVPTILEFCWFSCRNNRKKFPTCILQRQVYNRESVSNGVFAKKPISDGAFEVGRFFFPFYTKWERGINWRTYITEAKLKYMKSGEIYGARSKELNMFEAEFLYKGLLLNFFLFPKLER